MGESLAKCCFTDWTELSGEYYSVLISQLSSVRHWHWWTLGLLLAPHASLWAAGRNMAGKFIIEIISTLITTMFYNLHFTVQDKTSDIS